MYLLREPTQARLFKKNPLIGWERYLAGSGVRNQGILVLLPARDVVRLCDQFGSPTHRLELNGFNTSNGDKVLISYLDTVACLGIVVDCLGDNWRWAGTGRPLCERRLTATRVTHLSVMFSTPTATPREISFDLIAWAMFRMAMRPEEHSLFTVDMGTSWGIPAARAAAREAYAGEGGWQVPGDESTLHISELWKKPPTDTYILYFSGVEPCLFDSCLQEGINILSCAHRSPSAPCTMLASSHRQESL